MRYRCLAWSCAVLALWLAETAQACPTVAVAVEVDDAPPDARPVIQVPCVNVPPVIDGRLDDPVWQQAAVIDGFTQVDPDEGAAPAERTVVRLLYTPDALYIGVRAYDSQPHRIRATVRERNAGLVSDDRVRIVLDPLDTRRDGYMFMLNPLGARRDMLVDSRGMYDQWNGIWYGSSTMDAGGWTAEFEIPSRTLVFADGDAPWGFNISRVIRRNNEEVRWASVSRDLEFQNLSQTGGLGGLAGLQRGLGLDVRTSATLSITDEPGPGGSSLRAEPALDAFYRVTPTLTASLTANTDFSETPVDRREVNIGRFGLFLPETRAFFLQDVGVFAFGDGENNGRPFHSRRIGLVNGEVVDILAGGKLTGRVGDGVNVGLLNAYTDEAPGLGVDRRNLSVARVSVDVLDESSVGAILTHGNPAGDIGNTVYGADLRYRNSHFLQRNRLFTATGWVLQSDTEGVDRSQTAWGAEFEYPNDRINLLYRYRELGENYAPALGFVNRPGIREHSQRIRYRWRPEEGPMRFVDAMKFTKVTTDLDNRVESAEFNLSNWYETRSDDRVALWLRTTHERIDVPFSLPFGLQVPAGEYTFVRPRIDVNTSPARPVQFFGWLGYGDYYNGRRVEMLGRINLRPSGLFSMQLEYTQENITLAQVKGIVRVAALDFSLNLTPDLQWANRIQYDNVTDNLGINSRLRWIVRPGSETYLVLNQAYTADDWRFDNRGSEAVLKFGHTFRM